MKRKIKVSIAGVKIVAELDSAKRGEPLTVDEIECARDTLADGLMRAVADLPYFNTPLSKVRVK